jgi:DNA-binding NarL/FixJ family response regulator
VVSSSRKEARITVLARGRPGQSYPEYLSLTPLARTASTNRQIANAAFLSPKTVDNVLDRVYRKLDIASRAQLGAILARERSSP